MHDSFFALTDHELYVITAREQDRDNAMIASWVLPATLAPNRQRVVVLLSVSNRTTEMIRRSGVFALQMLSQQQADLVPRFGLVSGRDRDKFAGFEGRLRRSPNEQLVLLDDTCGWAECRVISSIELGDRRVVAAEVVAHAVHPGRTPLRKQLALQALPADVTAALRRKQHVDGTRDADLIRDV